MQRYFRLHVLRTTAFAVAALATISGCAMPEPQRMNAPPQGEGPGRPAWTDIYAYHNDQGMIADMSIADIHFIPGSADLSGTGMARLERYAELLAASGGTLHYAPTIGDEDLIQARLACAAEYLKASMPSDMSIRITPGLAAGRGMTNAESKSGQDVARQAEQRKNAYDLTAYQAGD